METYFRIEPGDRDPRELLDPAKQKSEPWGGTVRGRCDKCGGEGRTEHRCESCDERGPDPDCSACHGSVRYVGACPACEGTGEIDDSARRGVSVFPDEDALYRYMVARDAQLDGKCQLVTLQGEPSHDEDFDADEGALLIHPHRLVESRALDWERIEELKRERR